MLTLERTKNKRSTKSAAKMDLYEWFQTHESIKKLNHLEEVIKNNRSKAPFFECLVPFLLHLHILILKGGMSMDKLALLFLACVLAGFALIKLPLAGTALASIAPVTFYIGILSVLVFSLILIFKGILALIDK
jgi:hypothetical protein